MGRLCVIEIIIRGKMENLNIFQLIQVYLASDNYALESKNLYHAYQYTMSSDMTVSACSEVPDLDAILEDIKYELVKARDVVQKTIFLEHETIKTDLKVKSSYFVSFQVVFKIIHLVFSSLGQSYILIAF